ncbi:MAG: phosphoenolpyruvate--protein phosphotransferase [Chloroflexi bacterium]|nr:phosphoenolpyruvate--protein phosphotransferase [Chloroflexota bacterium]
MTRAVLEGRPGSPGVGIGRLLWVAPAPHDPAPAGPASNTLHAAGSRNGTGPSAEVDRLRSALEAAALELSALARDTTARAGDEVGAIFEAQALFARDPGIVEPAQALIRDGATAVAAIERVSAEQADLLAGVDDAYFRERAADLRDVARRVVDLLTGRARPPLHHRDGAPAILASVDLEPSLVAALRPELVTGIALAAGAPNGHAAIVARALGIPLALGLGRALDPGCDGRPGAVDGGEGRLVIDPTSDDLEAMARSSTSIAAAATSAVGKTSIAGSGHLDLAAELPVAIEANVSSVREAEQAATAGADGIGLVRTELLFLGRAVAPGLAEQRALYRRIAAEMAGRPVVFRTLDVGGDKPAAYLGQGSALPGGEANPALGVRGIRRGIRDPGLLRTQLRALLEATPDAPLRILLPMVSNLDEIRQARLALDEAAAGSRAAGEAVATDVRLGIMVEVPAAALMADALAPEVDFFSIGTNDLIQYTLAADRTNPELAELASPLQPAVLRLVAGVARAAAATGRPVAVCGEAAADPIAGPIFVGLGVTELSVAPGSVGVVRARLAALGPETCRAAADAALAARTVAEARAIAEVLVPVRNA